MDGNVRDELGEELVLPFEVRDLDAEIDDLPDGLSNLVSVINVATFVPTRHVKATTMIINTHNVLTPFGLSRLPARVNALEGNTGVNTMGSPFRGIPLYRVGWYTSANLPE